MKKACVALLLFAALLCTAALPALAASNGAAPAGYIEIWDRAGLEAIADAPGQSYCLMADIDMGGAPWAPIPFSGVLEGGGHTLYNLVIREADPQTAPSVDGNHKQYDTVYAALFSRAENATIQNLALLGVDVDISTEENCFAAGLVGYAENVQLVNCSVGGQVQLHATNWMCGVAGLVGFGYGTATGCAADVTLVLVDGNKEIKCEEFLGGMLATGYLDIENCQVRVRGYASVYGYVHNGGMVGMYYVHTDDRGHAGYVRNSSVDAVIHFFEANENRRAYCSAVIGEQLHWVLEIAGNTVLNFENAETKDYSTTLLPEMCPQPAYSDTVTPPGCQSFGYTTHSCASCGYSYTSAYTAPQHQPGEWQLVTQPAPGTPGLQVRQCQLCGATVEEETLVAATSCLLEPSSLELAPGETAQLSAQVQPQNAYNAALLYSSSDTAVATVNEQGLVQAQGPGTATISCTVAGGSAVASCSVQVRAAFPLWAVAAIAAAALAVLAAVLLLAGRRAKKRRAARHASARVYRRR